MAKKKSKRHHSGRRGRRVGAVAHHGLMSDGMALVGLVGGSVLATVIQRQATSLNPKIVSLLEIGGGLYLKHHATSPLMLGVGWGAMSAGAIGLAHNVGVIHGLDDMVSGLMNPGGTTYELDMPGRTSGLDNSQHVAFSGIRNDMRVTGMGGDEERIPAFGM